MKKIFILCAALALTVLTLHFALKRSSNTWQGVDETVVEKYARAAGREAHPPLIPTEQGDLQLFFFLVAGAAGGFAAGYCFRGLFPPRGAPSKDNAP